MGPVQCYDRVEGGNVTALNIYVYGNYNQYKGETFEEKDYWYDAINYNSHLKNSHFGRKYNYQLKWDVPD